MKKASSITFAMGDYVNLLKARYERLLRQSSCAASCALVLGRPVSDPSVLRVIKAGSVEDVAQVRVPYVELANGERSIRSEDISMTFTH